MQFLPFPKLARLNRDIVVTEKLDGTNAQVYIVDSMDPFSEENQLAVARRPVPDGFGRWELMFAGSRTRWITPEADNNGFAKWVKENAEELFELGAGQHFGEWWGGKIQRGYQVGLVPPAKRFSLFNTGRWEDRHMDGLIYMGDGQVGSIPAEGKQWAPACCRVVPVLYQGPFDQLAIVNTLERLRSKGSVAAPGFMRPEGIVVFHTAANAMFKVTLENDDKPKSLAA
jgi:hypothetical protein